MGGYVLGGLPCILCDNKTVFVHDIYSLFDFRDNGGIIERKVRFYEAYLRRYNVTVVVLDLKTGEFIKRKHRLNNDTLPCDWVLMPADNPKPKHTKDELLNFDF